MRSGTNYIHDQPYWIVGRRCCTGISNASTFRTDEQNTKMGISQYKSTNIQVQYTDYKKPPAQHSLITNVDGNDAVTECKIEN
jgi:hypothetical protein